MKTWNFYDKSEWPERGEWDSEPDKAQWKDPATGLDCLALRAHGHWCGYVGIPPEHPFHGKHYDKLDLEVHGGLTFSDLCDPRGHSDSEPRICHIAEPGEPEHLWWVGFDCAHAGDKSPATNKTLHEINLQFPMAHRHDRYRTLDYVIRETEALARQITPVKVPEKEGL